MPKIEKDLLKVKGSDGQWHYVPTVGGQGSSTPTWETVQNKPFSTLGDGLTVDEDGVLSAEGGGGSPNAVQYVAQELTDEQKAQARENIGAKAATEKSAYIISRTRSYGHISLHDMDFDGIYAQIQSGKVVMLLVNDSDTYYGVIHSASGSGKEIVFYNIVDISDSGGCDKGITYFGFTWRKGDNWLTEWWGDIPRVEVDSTLTNSGSAADAKAVGDELAKKQPKGDYLTTETDPTVPPWAKSPTKPTYTAAEVGALPNTTVIPPAYTLPQATSTALGGVKASEKTNEMTQQVGVDEEGILWTTKTPNVAKWALADLPFTENEISDTSSGAGFVTNPTNFEDGKTYFRYHAGATNFTWTNPNPQVGAVKITVLSWKQWDKTATGNSSYLNIIYSDGSKALFSPKNGIVSTYTTNATKTLSQIKGNYDIENWVLLDMDVMSIVADYDAPSGSSVTTDSELSLTSENPVQNKIVTSALAEKITAPSTASVGQIIKVKSVDNAGKPTEWEATDMPSGGGGGTYRLVSDTTLIEATDLVTITQDINGNPFELSDCLVWIFATATEESTLQVIPDGIWAAGTVVSFANKTKTDYPYDYLAYCHGDTDGYYGYTIIDRAAAAGANTFFNNARLMKATPQKLTSMKVSCKFAAGARIMIYGK